MATINLKMEPGGYCAWKARFCSGWLASVAMRCHSSPERRWAKRLGSKEGRLTMATISPVVGFMATTVPFFPAKAASAASWTFRSMVRKTLAPDRGSMRLTRRRARPRASTSICSPPSTPRMKASKRRSTPDCPRLSPGRKSRNSSRWSCAWFTSLT